MSQPWIRHNMAGSVSPARTATCACQQQEPHRHFADKSRNIRLAGVSYVWAFATSVIGHTPYHGRQLS